MQWGFRETQDQVSDLIFTDGQEAIESKRREDLDGTNTAQIPPVVTIRSSGHSGAVVLNEPPESELRSIGHNDVVFGKAFFSEWEGGDDKRNTVAKAKSENWSPTEGLRKRV